MNTKESSIKKMCSFYASDWHFSTMMLPYISTLLEEGTQIEMILEPEMEEKMKILMSKLNMNPETKQKLLTIHWNTAGEIEIKPNQKNDKKERVIMINGTKQEIDKINHRLEETITLEDKEKTTIINCYPVAKEKMQDILTQYDCMINTSGEHKIDEIFPE